MCVVLECGVRTVTVIRDHIIVCLAWCFDIELIELATTTEMQRITVEPVYVVTCIMQPPL